MTVRPGLHGPLRVSGGAGPMACSGLPVRETSSMMSVTCTGPAVGGGAVALLQPGRRGLSLDIGNCTWLHSRTDRAHCAGASANLRTALPPGGINRSVTGGPPTRGSGVRDSEMPGAFPNAPMTLVPPQDRVAPLRGCHRAGVGVSPLDGHRWTCRLTLAREEINSFEMR